jgi:hypothetical protein
LEGTAAKTAAGHYMRQTFPEYCNDACTKLVQNHRLRHPASEGIRPGAQFYCGNRMLHQIEKAFFLLDHYGATQ